MATMALFHELPFGQASILLGVGALLLRDVGSFHHRRKAFVTARGAPKHLVNKYFLNDWFKQKGHGFLGFHSATDTFKDYKPYWDMIGGSFNGHPWGSGNTVTITVHEPEHPTMKGFAGTEFQIKDEIYRYKNWQPEKVRVLMSLNMAKCKPSHDYMVPVAWVKSVGEGRMFYTNLGHNPATWQDKRHLASIEAGVKWVLHKVDGESKPNPELSAELEKKAKADSGK